MWNHWIYWFPECWRLVYASTWNSFLKASPEWGLALSRTWQCCICVAGPSGTPRPVRRRRRGRWRGGRAEAERCEPAGDRHVERGGRSSRLPEHGPGAAAAGAPGAAPLRHGSPPTRLSQLVTVGRWWLRLRPVVDQRAERLECSDWQVELTWQCSGVTQLT